MWVPSVVVLPCRHRCRVWCRCYCEALSHLWLRGSRVGSIRNVQSVLGICISRLAVMQAQSTAFGRVGGTLPDDTVDRVQCRNGITGPFMTPGTYTVLHVG